MTPILAWLDSPAAQLPLTAIRVALTIAVVALDARRRFP